jgi:hypothetical protein
MAGPLNIQFLVVAMLALALAGCASAGDSTADRLQSTVAPPPAPTVQGLMGASPAVLQADFGQPALRRIDGAAQVWLYHSSVCGLNIILFPGPDGTPRVADAVPDSADPLRCMESLQHTGPTDAALDTAPSS